MGLYTKIIDLQKLKQAWEKVRLKKAAPGIDGVTVDMFAVDIPSALKQLNLELKEQRYEPMQVRIVVLQKNEKEREIGLFCLRDKIVQQSIANELHKLYDESFARESYAFHSNRSALEAVSRIEKAAKSQPDCWVLKTDIRHFFDEIGHEKLIGILGQRIKEADVLQLIEQFLKVQSLDDNGELRKKERGIYQGSTIAPLLSNIYLNEFDHLVKRKVEYYCRYADDILCLDRNPERIKEVLEEIQRQLAKLELQLNEEKTHIGQVEDGFEYLGYRFGKDRKKIPAKKEAALKERLEELWLENLEFDKKAEKGLEILNGWVQYFSGKRKIESIYELVLEVYRKKGKSSFEKQITLEQVDMLLQIRRQFRNIYPDICSFLAELWGAFDKQEAVLMEYEQLWQLDGLDSDRKEIKDEKAVAELIALFRLLSISQTKETLENIMQLYADLRCYSKAAVFDGKIKELERVHQLYVPMSHPEVEDDRLDSKIDFSMLETELERYHQLFIGREDIYASETVNSYGKRAYEMVKEPLTLEKLEEEMKNQVSIATYVQRNNGTAHFVVFDLDVSKKILLKYEPGTAEFHEYLALAKKKAYLLKKVLFQLGLSSLLEFSGFRGYHLWIFFQEWISIRYIHLLQEIILQKLQQEETEANDMAGQGCITIEVFPNHTRVTAEKPGQCIRMPFSRHIRSGNRSCFLDDFGEAYKKQTEALEQAAQYPLSVVKRIIAANGASGTKREKESFAADDVVRENVIWDAGKGKPSVSEDFPDLKPVVRIVLEHCNLMQYLCRKSKTTNYLTHFERQTIAYVFGHLGDDGKAFVHQIMEYTLNYRYSTTERFLQKLPEKPISCIKLREQYKQVTAGIGCNCNFKRTKNCYPSPVLHAVKDNEEIEQGITLPLSRTVSRTKEKEIYEEINVHKKAQELAEKLLELKKQKRGIDKSVRKLEDELTEIFNNVSVDCMEIEMGLLIRKRKDDRYEWVIEL